MDLSIITVTWNSEEFITPLILSVQKACKNSTYEHIIVDNGSTDKTVEIIEQQFPHIQLIKNTTNLGFAAANNIAVHQVLGRYLFFLNPDLVLEKGAGDSLVAYMDQHSEVGILGAKLTNKNHEIDYARTPRRFPTLLNQIVILLKLPHLFPGLLNHYHYRDKDFSVDQEVDSVPGSCLLMRRTLYEACGYAFDPRYYIWFEDVDICREAKKRGYKVRYTTLVEATDYIGQSFQKTSFFWKQKQFIKSMVVYFKKWGFSKV